MGALSIWHWLIFLLIVAMVFGTGKLKDIGKDLGSAVKGFKEGMKTDEENNQPNANANAEKVGQTIEGEVKEKL